MFRDQHGRLHPTMVSLTIHLSKAGISCGVKEMNHISATSPPDEGAAIPSCLADCSSPLLKGVGSVFSDARAGNSVGMKASRRPGDKVHLCVKCNFPIAVYGRLEPCEHVYCLMCAALDATCFLCNKSILRIQKMDVLEGIFICGAPGCLRSFLARPEFDWHVVEFHSQFLQPEPERNSFMKGSCFFNSLEVQGPRLQAAEQHLDVASGCQTSGPVQVVFLKKEDALHQQFKSILQDSHGLLGQLVPEHPVMYQSQEQSFVKSITHACLDNRQNLDPPCRDQTHQQNCKEWDFQTPWQKGKEKGTEHERAYQGKSQREMRVEVGLSHAFMKRVNDLQCPPPPSHPPPKELKRDRDSLQAQLAQPPTSLSTPTYLSPSSSKVFNVQHSTVSYVPQFEPLLGLCHHGMVIQCPTEYRENTMQLRHFVPSISVLHGEGLITPSKEDIYVQKSPLGPAVDGIGRGNPSRPVSMNPQGHLRQKRPFQPRYQDDFSYPMSSTTMDVPRCPGPLPPPCSPPMRVQNDVHSGPALPGLREIAMDYSWGLDNFCSSGGIPGGHVFPEWMPPPNI